MNVVILDTGCANLSSVKYAVQRLGYEPDVSRGNGACGHGTARAA